MDFNKLIKKSKRKPMIDLDAPSLEKVDYGRDALYRILPNRDPFLFLDRIVGIDLKARAIVGERRIDPDDPLFAGHFPDNPIYPGVLQLEMLSELFCCLYYFIHYNSTDLSGPAVHLRGTRLHDAFLQYPVRPGDQLTIVTKVLELTPYTYTGIGQILNAENVAAAVIGEFFIVDE